MKYLLIVFLLFSNILFASQRIGFAFLYKAPTATAPTVSSIAPTSGTTAGGTGVTITGTGFVSGATATIGGTTCTSPSVSSSTTLTCTTGARSAGTVSATVTNPSTLSGTGGSYTYVAPLAVNVTCWDTADITGFLAVCASGDYSTASVNTNTVYGTFNRKIKYNCPSITANGTYGTNVDVNNIISGTYRATSSTSPSMVGLSHNTYGTYMASNVLTANDGGGPVSLSGSCTVIP